MIEEFSNCSRSGPIRVNKIYFNQFNQFFEDNLEDLETELQELKSLRVLIALGHGAHNSLLKLFQAQGLIKRLAEVPFGHGKAHRLANGITLVGCYHTSRYNVQTGRMNSKMFLALLDQVRLLLK